MRVFFRKPLCFSSTGKAIVRKTQEIKDMEGERRGIVPPPFLKGEVLDRFVSMRNEVLRIAGEESAGIFGVTSSRPKEGKTTISICLALAFAMDTRRKVLVVDGNLRNPSIHTFFGASMSPGLSNLIRGDVNIPEAIGEMERFPLRFLASGTLPSIPPSDLFVLDGFARTIQDLKTAFDMIIVDTPNVTQYQDFGFLGRHLDGAILVIEADRTQLPVIVEVKKKIESFEIPIIGVTMNRKRNAMPSFVSNYLGVD